MTQTARIKSTDSAASVQAAQNGHATVVAFLPSHLDAARSTISPFRNSDNPHLQFLAQSNLRVSVLVQWAWTYLTGQRGSRLIVNHYGAGAREVSRSRRHLLFDKHAAQINRHEIQVWLARPPTQFPKNRSSRVHGDYESIGNRLASLTGNFP